MPKRILVPLDGTPIGEAVLPHVAQVARAIEAHVELLHVVPARFVRHAGSGRGPAPAALIGAPAVLPTLSPSATVLDSYHFDPTELETTRRYVERVAEWLRSDGLETSVAVVEGSDVADEVLRRAQDFDFLAFSASVLERRRLGRLVYGVVSERLIHESTTPILLVRVPHAAS